MSEPSDGYSPAERLRRGTRDEVRAALLTVRARTLELADAYADALGPAMEVPRDPGLNPPRWELGHLAWFQEWWVARNGQRHLGARADPDAARAPASLDQADDWFDSGRIAHATRWSLPLPPLADVRDWLSATLQGTLAQLAALPADAGEDALYFYRLAALHEAMHGEAACYMARTLGFAVPLDPVAPVSAAGVLAVPAQRVVVGSRAGAGFAFDNELQAHAIDLPAYEIDAAPVTWDQVHAFVDAGGYAERRWWTDTGWLWMQKERGQRPPFPRGGGTAVHLACHEAEAWCRWAGRRLPTEAEWECAALTQPGFTWGQAWEWTASAFRPYPGFDAHPYRDYSQPWFGTHRVLRGAGPATSHLLAHPRYRNFFVPERCDIHAGFRSCAGPAAPVAV